MLFSGTTFASDEKIEYSKNNEYSIACYDKDYTILNRYFDISIYHYHTLLYI